MHKIEENKSSLVLNGLHDVSETGAIIRAMSESEFELLNYNHNRCNTTINDVKYNNILHYAVNLPRYHYADRIDDDIRPDDYYIISGFEYENGTQYNLHVYRKLTTGPISDDNVLNINNNFLKFIVGVAVYYDDQELQAPLPFIMKAVEGYAPPYVSPGEDQMAAVCIEDENEIELFDPEELRDINFVSTTACGNAYTTQQFIGGQSVIMRLTEQMTQQPIVFSTMDDDNDTCPIFEILDNVIAGLDAGLIFPGHGDVRTRVILGSLSYEVLIEKFDLQSDRTGTLINNWLAEELTSMVDSSFNPDRTPIYFVGVLGRAGTIPDPAVDPFDYIQEFCEQFNPYTA